MPAAASSRSPAAKPCVSFTRLKPSKSRIARHCSSSPAGADRSRACSSRSQARRFGNPVSESNSARRANSPRRRRERASRRRSRAFSASSRQHCAISRRAASAGSSARGASPAALSAGDSLPRSCMAAPPRFAAATISRIATSPRAMRRVTPSGSRCSGSSSTTATSTLPRPIAASPAACQSRTAMLRAGSSKADRTRWASAGDPTASRTVICDVFAIPGILTKANRPPDAPIACRPSGGSLESDRKEPRHDAGDALSGGMS